ncbi:resolvase [Methylobacterium sp. Leaf122]|nr:resolvase [Methylobacterium sp. Leaf122]
MAEGRFISYLRVSTAKQGASGLGLEAQRRAVTEFLNGGRWTLITEVVEVESGKRNDRPRLDEALKLCRLHNATLVIAKLDRLSRDAAFLLNLQSAGVRFIAADMPEANEMVVGIMAVVAQAERKMISARTKAALAASQKKLGGHRGVVISGVAQAKGRDAQKARAVSRAADLSDIVAEIQAGGATSLREIAAGLNERAIPTARGGQWSAVQVQRVLARQV